MGYFGRFRSTVGALPPPPWLGNADVPLETHPCYHAEFSRRVVKWYRRIGIPQKLQPPRRHRFEWGHVG